jgi:hypothetical protein
MDLRPRTISESQGVSTMDQISRPNSGCQDVSTMNSRPLPISNSQNASTMEWGSYPVLLPSPRPTSSVYSDDKSVMICLIRSVSEEIRAQEYQTITSYIRENQVLEEKLEQYRGEWKGTIMLANEVMQAITIIKESRTRVDANAASAEKDWLAFWGIYKESVGSHLLWL